MPENLYAVEALQWGHWSRDARLVFNTVYATMLGPWSAEPEWASHCRRAATDAANQVVS